MVLLWSTPGTKLAPRGGSTYWYKRNSVPDQWAGFQMTDFDIVQEGEKNQCGNISPTIKNRFHKLWQSKAICISGNTLVTFITGISSLNPFWIVKKAFLHSEFFRGENCYEYNLIKCNRWDIPLNLIYKYRYTLFLRTKKNLKYVLMQEDDAFHTISTAAIEDRRKSWTGIYRSAVYSFKKK